MYTESYSVISGWQAHTYISKPPFLLYGVTREYVLSFNYSYENNKIPY